ncbi:unnamed protein product [Rotaria sp. Silwood1]|nr:unnamed protein product [Rotaria sp. Silwood1]
MLNNNNKTIEIDQEPHAVNQFQEDQRTEAAMDVDDPKEHISTLVSENQLLHNYKNQKDELGIELRLIESMLLQCGHLIKQSTSTNVSHEEFVKSVYNYATNLVTSSNELRQLCSRKIDQLNKERDSISLIEPKKQVFIERDPGNYPQNYNYRAEERRFLVNIGPFQPSLSNFPKNDTMAASKDTCKFVSKWYNEYPMIEYSIKNDAAFCFVCRLLHEGPGCQKKDKAWIDVGVSSWSKMKGRGRNKKGKLDAHFTSISHKASYERYLIFKNKSCNVDSLLDENRRKAQQQETAILERNKNIIITLIDSARFLCRQGLAFRREPAKEGKVIKTITLN